MPRSGTTTTKVSASLPPMMNAMVIAKMSMKGDLTAVLMIIMKEFCTLVMSVVILVTREDVENLSMFPKENCWTLLNMSDLRFPANPAAALAAKLPARAPHASERRAASTIAPPVFAIFPRSAPVLMLLTMSAVMYGISTSRITSPIMHSSVRKVSFLYCLSDFKIFKTMQPYLSIF